MLVRLVLTAVAGAGVAAAAEANLLLDYLSSSVQCSVLT